MPKPYRTLNMFSKEITLFFFLLQCLSCRIFLQIHCENGHSQDGKSCMNALNYFYGSKFRCEWPLLCFFKFPHI